MEKLNRPRSSKAHRTSRIHPVAVGALAAAIFFIPIFVAFAAEMLQGGALEINDVNNYWTKVVNGQIQIRDGEAGHTGDSLGFRTDKGDNRSGDAYIYQNTTGTINNNDTVQLSFWWKKRYDAKVPNKHIIFVDIRKPSSAVVRIWEETTPSNANSWNFLSQDVSSFFDETGIYEIRIGADFQNGKDGNARTYGWFDEVSLDATPFVDTTPPTVSITDPTDGALISGTYTILANATDDVAVDRVEFFYDSNLIGTDNTSPYSIQWNTTGAADGAHSLTATAYDTSALSSTSTPVNVTVDNTGPTSSITDPVDFQSLPGTNYAIIGTADDINFLQYTLEYGAGASPASWNDIGTNPRTSAVVSGTLGTWDTTLVSDGTYTIRLITTDSVNNSTTTTVQVDVDRTPPTVVSAVAVGPALVDVLFSEDMNPSTLDPTDFTIDNGLNVSGAALLTDNRTVRLNTDTQTEGITYTVTVTTFDDVAGNVVGSPNTAQFDGFTPDTIPPSVTITDPTDGSYIGSNYPITADATDNVMIDRVAFYYNGNLIGVDNSFPYSLAWDNSLLAEGAYTLSATAYDTSNNSTASAPVGVSLDKANPAATISDPVTFPLLPETSYSIVGTAWDSNFLQYTLEYGAGVSPTSWNDIGTNPRTASVISDTLGVWDTSPVSDGIYTIKLTVVDLAGNSSTRIVQVNVDSTAPTVVSAAAVNPIRVDVLFSENLKPSSVQPSYFSIDNGLVITNAILRGDNRTVRLDTSLQTEGTTYTVTVNGVAPTIEDVAGNVLGSPNTVQFGGFSGPISLITAPAEGQSVNGIITITGTADDPDFTEYVLEYARGKLPSNVSYEDIGTNPRLTPVTSGTLGTWDMSGLGDGDYTIRLITKNSLAEETTATVRVVLDTSPPVVNSARAIDGTTVDVLFGEQISASVDPAYFSITGLTVSGAVRLEDFRTVRLTTSSQTPDTNYTVTVRGTSPTVADLNGTEITGTNNTADFTGFNTSVVRGDGFLLRRHPDDSTCGGSTMGCHNLLVHSSATTSTTYGTWGSGFGCGTCHEPHGTRNIYLVKETITTPNSGNKTVDLRTIGRGDPYNNPDPVPGAHDYSMGDATDGFNDSVCEVCHTQTSHFRNVDASTPDPNHNNDATCVICHPHTMGFTIAPTESEGGFPCSACHPEIFDPMNGDTSQYHHYLNNTDVDYPVITDSSTLTAADTNKRCLMCHVDHDIFRPELNAANGGERGRNLRETVKQAVTTSSNFTNSDYSASHPDGGICLSCHENSMTKNTANQKDDGSTSTLPIDKAQFDAAISAHNYQTTSTFQTDASTFHANCVKCHSDTLPKTKQGPTGNAFGLHASLFNRILEPLGITNPTSGDDPLEERFCYECHTGGASGNAPDYYGAVTMDQEAINVADLFTKTYRHPIDSTSGLHKSQEGAAPSIGWNKGANRHVECTDCHNPHAAQDGLHTKGSNIIGPALLGQWGVKPTSWGPGGTQHTSFAVVNFTDASPGSDQYEAYLCFKCHSYFAYDTNPPNTPSGNPDGTVAAQTDIVSEFNPNNYGHHAAIQPGNHPPHPNFTQTFVSPWGPDSTVVCSDCHASDVTGDPAGTHGSNNKWLLRKNETGTGTAAIFCYNCHRRDVYGDVNYTPPNSSLSRIKHPIENKHSDPQLWPFNGIYCMNCHGGGVLGGLHGSNAGPGPAGGSSPLGIRLLNGAAITGIDLGSLAQDGRCWVPSNASEGPFTNCHEGHTGKKYKVNYDLP